MTSRPHVQWWPDPESARILAAYRRRREPIRDILRRALRLLAHADGICDASGRVVIQPGHRRREP